MRTFRLLLFCACIFFPLSGLGLAAEDSPREALDAVKTALAGIDDELKLDNLSDSQLAELRARGEPLAGQLQSVAAELAPRLEASRKRLAELTPKSKEGEAQPDPVAAELKAEQTKFDKLDADLRSARAALLQVDDYITRITNARREIFTKQTFARTTSILSPTLWLAVARELPDDIGYFRRLLTQSIDHISSHLTWPQLAGFVAVCAMLLILAVPIRWMAHRVIAPDPKERAPGRLRAALVAAWTLIVLTALPLAGLGIFSYALDVFDISDPPLQGVVNALLDGLRVTVLIRACARAAMAPKLESWRMTPISDRSARRLFRLAIAVAVLWSAAHWVEAVAQSVSSYNLLVLARALSAVAISAIAANTFRKLGIAEDPGNSAKQAGGYARSLGWAYILAIFVCALAGYNALATFLVEHALQIGAAVTILYLVDALLQESCDRLLQPESPVAKSLMAILGLRREGLDQIVVLLQAVERLAGIAAFLAVAVGPFGMPSQDFLSTLRMAYFGFTIGGVTLSISSLVGALVVFLGVLAASRASRAWLGDRYLPRTRLDAGVKNSIRTISGYLGVVVALVAGGSRLGVEADRLTWIAGGLSVGIGFGLQGIANNFISGLILLWERGIRVGDWVVVGQDQGFVSRINARATEIETFDRATLIVPNSTLVTGAVKNWLHTDSVGRIVLTINAAFESDPEVVRVLLIDAAKAQQAVLSIPAPLALFAEIGDWALKFQLVCYVEDALLAERVKSELNFDVMARMRAAALRIPYPFPVANSETERGPNSSKMV